MARSTRRVSAAVSSRSCSGRTNSVLLDNDHDRDSLSGFTPWAAELASRLDRTTDFGPRPGQEVGPTGWLRGEAILAGYLAWVTAMLAVTFTVYDHLDDIVSIEPEPATATLEGLAHSVVLESVEQLDPTSTVSLAGTFERFLGLFNDLLQDGNLSRPDHAAGEHSLKQYYGEMNNPEGPTAHVIRNYGIKMFDIYRRHIGIEELRAATDDETANRLNEAVDAVVAMGGAVDPSVAADLAAQIPAKLEPKVERRNQLTAALGWGSGAAVETTKTAGYFEAGSALLRQLAHGLPTGWGALIGAVLGLLHYTFKPKGKP